MKLINIGFGNMVCANRLVAIVSPESAPIKRIIQDARDKGALVDATYGRRTRAVIITDSDHVILSAVQPETVANRLVDDDDDDEEDLPKIIRRRPSAKPAAPEEFDEEETSPKASIGDTKPYTSPSKPQITEDGIPDVDLSAIRQQISEEVQRIYEDDQNS